MTEHHDATDDDSRVPFPRRSTVDPRLVTHAPTCGTHPVYAAVHPAMPDTIALQRLDSVIRATVARLPDDDRAARIDYCRRHREHGVRILREGDDYRLTWGGRLLARVPADALTDPSSSVVLTATYVDAAPDDASSLVET